MNFTGLQRADPQRARVYSLGRTLLMNLDIPIVLISRSVAEISADATFEEAAAILRANGRAKLFHQGLIHGGEASSAEGALAMLHEMVGGYGGQYLDKVDYICVPRVNVEGAARFTRSSVHPQAIGMNSDHIRLRTNEIRYLHKAYLELMPEVVMDGQEIGYYTVADLSGAYLNVPAGSYATGGITDIETAPSTSLNNPSMEVVEHALSVYAAKLFDDLTTGGLRVDHYQNGAEGWTANNSIGRAYYGLMGSVSFIVGVRGGGSYLMERRAWSHVLAAKSLLETLHANDAQTKALVRAARDKAAAIGRVFDPSVEIYLNQTASGNTKYFRLTGDEEQGAKYSPYKGQRWQADMLGNIVKVSANDANMVMKSLALNDTSVRRRARPTAYVVPKGIKELTSTGGLTVDANTGCSVNYGCLLEMLDGNRIKYYELDPGASAPVRQYHRTDTGNATSGDIEAGLRDEETVTFGHGAYVVPLDQTAGAAAVAIFEPDITNSNGFNASVAQTLGGTQGLAVITNDIVTRNYPYYRLEKNNPREALPCSKHG